MRAAPIPGTIERIAMIVPQNAAPSMPATQNAKPARAPWIMPITSVPFTVAPVIEGHRCSIRSSSSFTRAQIIKNFLQDFLAVFEKEKHRIDHDEQIQKKNSRGRRHSRCHRDQKASDGF